MKSTPIIPCYIPLMSIRYKNNYWKVLGFIATEGAGSTDPGGNSLYHFPDNYSNVYIIPFDHPNMIGRYLNACNLMYNHNRVRPSDLALEKYWVTQSGSLRISRWVWG